MRTALASLLIRLARAIDPDVLPAPADGPGDAAAGDGMTPSEIKAALLLRGASQAEIAESIGVDRRIVSDVINGRRSTRRIREAVAKALGKEVAAIWPDEIYRRPSGRIVRRAEFKLKEEHP